MRRSVVALMVGALGLLAVPVTPAAGQTARGDPGAPALLGAAPAPGSSADASGLGFALTADPGATVVEHLVVTNRSPDRRFTVRVQPVDATRTAAGVRARPDAPSGAASWITASIAVSVLEPGASAEVPLLVTLPHTVASGDVAVAALRVFAERADPVPPGTAGPSLAVEPLPTVEVPVEITVAGVPAPQLEVVRVRAATDEGTPQLEVTVRNSGGVTAAATGTVRAAGARLERELQVEVDPRKETSVRVPWAEIDVARGADVVVELHYGAGRVASWVGTVGADPRSVPPVARGDADVPDAAPDADEAPAAAGSANVLGIVVGVLVLLAMLAAGAWLVAELARGKRGVRIPIDPGTIQLQLTMDPRHTDVLDALVTQVGALGDAIGHLADRVGVPVVIPPAPTVPRPRRARGRHHASATPARCAPAVETPDVFADAGFEPAASAPAAPAASRSDLAPPAERPARPRVPFGASETPGPATRPPAPGDGDAPVPPPTFIPPAPPRDDWLSDARLDALMARRDGAAAD